MQTDIKLSDKIENNIFVTTLDHEDIEKKYLQNNIVVIDDFVSEEDVGIFNDLQITNMRKIWYDDATKRPRKYSNHPQFKDALIRLEEKIKYFAKGFSFINNSHWQDGWLDYDATLRISEVANKKMHLDRYKFNPLRVFVNIDNTHRIWKTTSKDEDFKSGEKHLIAFAPGTLWCCDTKEVPHQVSYGKRVAVFTFYF